MTRRRGFALVELLVVIVLILVLAAAYVGYTGRGNDDEVRESIPGRSIQQAESLECRTNLSQLRNFVQMQMTTEGQPPAQLHDAGIQSIRNCPVSGQPYSYDPQSGRVWCSTPGHERY